MDLCVLYTLFHQKRAQNSEKPKRLHNEEVPDDFRESSEEWWEQRTDGRLLSRELQILYQSGFLAVSNRNQLQ